MCVDARIVWEAEGRIAGSIFFIVVSYFLRVRHATAVTHLERKHSGKSKPQLSRREEVANYQTSMTWRNYQITRPLTTQQSNLKGQLDFFNLHSICVHRLHVFV